MRDAILGGVGVDIEAMDHPGVAAGRSSGGKEHRLARPPSWGKGVEQLFEEYVEPTLIQPTFIIDYPVEISPLAKKKPGSANLVERFEFFIGGLECGNAFTELNDPLDQRERFASQVRAAAKGDDESAPHGRGLCHRHGARHAPTGGLGFGIDRLVMLFTDQASIREVILFPALRNAPAEDG